MDEEGFIYLGSELEIFANTPNWKKYVQAEISKVIQNQDYGVEIGSGLGSNSPYLSKFVRKYIGIEPDANLVEKSKMRYPNFEFEVGFSAKLEELKVPVNLIFYIDVLEHIEDDQMELALVAQFLAPNGKIVILVPAFEFLFSNFDRRVGHFRRYSKSSLASKVPDSLKITEIKYLDCLGMLLSFLAKMFSLNNAVTTRSIRIWHSLIPLSKNLDHLFRNRFGKSIFLVLERVES
jgi:SAM-dependent methyltransferase